MSKKRKNYDEHHSRIMQDLVQGLSVSQASKKYGVPNQTIYRWLKKQTGEAKPSNAMAVDSKSLSKHPNIKEARILLEEFRNLIPNIKSVSRRDLLALLALTELEQIP
jgi:transposase